jgi:hypothetical protein
MINKEVAIEVKLHALNAVEELGLALKSCHLKCSDEEFMVIKKAVGISIGRINLDLLDYIYSMHPELNHLL